MPATQRGAVERLKSAKGYSLRYRDRDGNRRRVSPFKSRSAAWKHYRDVTEPELRGEPTPLPDLTLAEFVPMFLDRHAATGVRPRTVSDLRKRLVYALRAFGDVPLRDLERMSGEVAAWQTTLPERSRYGIVGALRQALGAAARWGHISANPAVLAGRNRQPAPRGVRGSSATSWTPWPPSWRPPASRSRCSLPPPD